MKKKPLLFQLLLYSYGVIIVLLIIAGLAYYHTSSNIIKHETERNTQNTIQQSSQFIDSYVQHLEETSTSLASNTSFLNSSNKEQITLAFKTILETNSDLKTITYISKDGKIITTDNFVNLSTSKDMMKEDWYRKAIGKKAMPILLPAHMQNKEKMTDWVISITQEVQNTNHENQGVLKIDLSYRSIANYLKDLKLGNKGFAFIINQKGEYIYHPKESVYHSNQEMEEMKAYITTKNSYVHNGEFYVSQISMPSSQWIIVGVSSLDQLNQLKRNLIFSFLIIGLIIIFSSSFLITLGAKKFISPIKQLQETILKISDGDHNLRAQVTGPDELRTLSSAFNQMLEQNDRLLVSIKQNQEEIRNYELQALASQINPHFLYNTLDSIIWMAEFQDNKRVVNMTKSLASYFRLALNQGNEKISLKNEIDHVRNYLFIQKQRYGNRLSYDINEDKNCDDFIIPKLILQPLVENAIYHGIKEVQRDGKITIKTANYNHFIKIIITDNGKGFDQSKSSQSNLERGGVGLENVKRRLALEFGERFTFTIKSEIDEFTKITIKIPKNKN
ncbi:MAG: sensor histidine kinase [Streptococcus sp.]|nr:sensor histidine kinase [Streptococcus sp.]